VGLFRVSPLLWVVVGLAFAVVVAWLAWRRSRWTWLAAAAAIPLTVPRIWLPDAAYVSSVAGAVGRRRDGG
jgi:hypothetical protein